MKKITSMSILIVFCSYSYSQVDTFSKQAPPHDYTYYMEKNRRQMIDGCLLLVGGAAVGVVGTIVHKNGHTQDQESANLDLGSAATGGMGTIIAATGFLAAAGSIPLFIASGRNKTKAQSISTGLKMENLPAVQRSSVFNRSYPAVSIKLAL